MNVLKMFFINISTLVYFDAAQACHDLSFNFGQAAQGLSSVSTTRQFSVKVSVWFGVLHVVHTLIREMKQNLHT